MSSIKTNSSNFSNSIYSNPRPEPAHKIVIKSLNCSWSGVPAVVCHRCAFQQKFTDISHSFEKLCQRSGVAFQYFAACKVMRLCESGSKIISGSSFDCAISCTHTLFFFYLSLCLLVLVETNGTREEIKIGRATARDEMIIIILFVSITNAHSQVPQPRCAQTQCMYELRRCTYTCVSIQRETLME